MRLNYNLMPGEGKHKQQQSKQVISYLPQANQISYLVDLSATSNLHNPIKVSSAFAFYCHKPINL